MPLDVAALNAADRSHLLAALASFKGKAGGSWLRAGHPAEGGQFDLAGWPVVGALPTNELIEAVAMAAPNHCIDGWSFAARATASLLSGDYHSCRHLSYYAQLRAGLSILANLGVGLFNTINFSVDAAGNIRRLDTAGHPRGMPTHAIVWAALKQWSGNSTSARLFLDLVRIRGISIMDCVRAIWPGASGTSVAGDLIAYWGLDLSRGKDEHLFRNISSYNPHSLNPLSSSMEAALQLVEQIWELCEPTTGGSFNALDRFLLRNVLQAQHRVVHGNTDYASGGIAHNYEAMSPLVKSIASLDFLTGVSGEADPALLDHARATTNPAEPIEMLARAYLLLRAATALTHSSFVDAGMDLAGGDLRAWIDEIAERRGFWRPGASLPDPTDLWADIELALLDFVDAKDPTPASWFDWMAVSSRGMPQITEMERIGVWSLGS